MNWRLVFLLLTMCSTQLVAQTTKPEPQVLANKDVVAMLSDGLPGEIVAAKIRASRCAFDTSVTALKELRGAKVPDGVILAMVESPKEVAVVSDGHVRVFITDSQSWESHSASWFHGSGSAQNGNGSFTQNGGSHSSGGARPQTAEIIKTFTERCPDVLVTNQLESANYAVTLDHEGGKGLARRDNKVAVFKKSGDLVYSGSTRELGNGVKDACVAIKKDGGLPLAPSK
jgi:hypothetical protein